MGTDITVCYGKKCRAKHSEKILDVIQDHINHPKCPITAVLEMTVNVKLCNKFCEDGPWMSINSDIYLKMDEVKAIELLTYYELNDQKKILAFNPIREDSALSG